MAAQLWQTLPPDLVRAADEQGLRKWVHWPSLPPARYGDRHLQAAMIDRLPSSLAERNAGLLVLACHENGFVRERALAKLTEIASPAALTLLALRLSDWVDPVRRQAEVTWSRLLSPAHLERAIAALPTILGLLTRKRMDFERIWRPFASIFETSAGHEALLACLTGNDERVSRSAFFALGHLEERPNRWLETALSSPVAWVRLEAARLLADASGVSRLDPGLLLQMTRDPFHRVRQVALEIVKAAFPHYLEQVVRQGLVDRNAAIRQDCQSALVLIMDVDPVPLYHAWLEQEASPSEQAAALFGLAETGGRDERPRFEAFLASPFAQIRAAAVLGWSRFAEDGDVPTLFGLLGDRSPRVVRAAEVALQKLPWPPESLVAAVGAAASHATGLAAISLSRRLGMAGKLEVLMAAAGLPDAQVKAKAQYWIAKELPRRWLFTGISPLQKRQLLQRLDDRPLLLQPLVEKQLRSILS